MRRGKLAISLSFADELRSCVGLPCLSSGIGRGLSMASQVLRRIGLRGPGMRRMEFCGWIRQVTEVADEELVGYNEPMERSKHTAAKTWMICTRLLFQSSPLSF